jgi:hypothetical protein
MTRFRAWIFGTILIFGLVAGIWRFFDRNRDPDIVTETSQDAWGDPSFYLYNARSRVLFGDWRARESLSLYVTPGYAFLSALSFWIFGTTYSTAMIQSTLAGFVMIAATGWAAECAARAEGDVRRFHALAGSVVSMLASYVIFAVQRVPNGDMESLAVMTSAAALMCSLQSIDLDRHRTRFRWAAVLAGCATGLAPFVKLHTGLYSFASLCAWLFSYFLIDSSDWKIRWRRATPFLAAGLAMAGLIWIGWIFWLYGLGVLSEVSRQASRLGVFSVFTVNAHDPHARTKFDLTRFFQSNLFYRQPVETLLATFGLFSFWTSRRRNKNWPLLLCSIWLAVGIVALMGMTVSPMRYRLIFWPAILVVATQFWTTLASARSNAFCLENRRIAAMGTGVALACIIAYFVSARLHWGNVEVVALILMIPSIGAAVALWKALPRLDPQILALGAALILVGVTVPQWINGERSVSHELLQTSTALEKYPNAVLGGGWGVRLGFSSPRNAYFDWTPEAARKVTLLVEDPASDYFQNVSLPWRELERHQMHRVPLTILFVEIER